MATASLFCVISKPLMKSSISTSPGWIGSSRSVIVDEFDMVRTSVLPYEADPPLPVDPDAVLASPVALQRLQPIARRNPKIVEHLGRVQLLQLPESRAQDPGVVRSDALLAPEPLRVTVPERPD